MKDLQSLRDDMETYAILLAVMHEEGDIEDADYFDEMAEVQAILDMTNEY